MLDEALRLAAARGYVRPLLGGGEPARDLLRGALVHPVTPAAREHARLVLEAFEAEPQGFRPPSASSHSGDQHLDRLTSREEQVLDCLSRGESNKAISRSLFVSVDTVKTHLKRIYAKLGVADRSQAVVRARELGLLAQGE